MLAVSLSADEEDEVAKSASSGMLSGQQQQQPNPFQLALAAEAAEGEAAEAERQRQRKKLLQKRLMKRKKLLMQPKGSVVPYLKKGPAKIVVGRRKGFVRLRAAPSADADYNTSKVGNGTSVVAEKRSAQWAFVTFPLGVGRGAGWIQHKYLSFKKSAKVSKRRCVQDVRPPS